MLADSSHARLQSPIEIMRFTLIYDGPLPAQTNHESRTDYKHAIRRQFHSQLLELWQTHPALARNYDVFLKLSPDERAATGVVSDDESLLVYRNQALHGPRHDNIIVQLTRRNVNSCR